MSDETTAPKVRQLLEQPFPPEAIRTRPGSHGQELSYCETHMYIRRLNEAYNGSWSFEIAGHEINQDVCIVIGKLRTPDCLKMAFGSSNITRKRDTNEVIDLGDTLKAAASDALKKACSLLGLGLHLYSDEPITKPAPKSNGNGTVDHDGHPNATTHNGNGNGTAHSQANGGNGEDRSRLSSKQLGLILALGRERSYNRDTLNKMSLDRFATKLDFITRSEASVLIQELQQQAA